MQQRHWAFVWGILAGLVLWHLYRKYHARGGI